MDADSLNDGFRVGDWLIEPRESRASTDGRTVDLSNDQLAVLIALATRHGEAVNHRALRNEIWPDGVGSEEKLRQAVSALRELFGDKPRHRRYIASVGNDAYALVAHFERVAPVAAAPAPLPVDRTTSATPVGRWQQLFAELQRRHVFKVIASYMVGMWVMLQVAQVTFEPLRFPAWWMTALTILAVIGLPIVTALAWTYEITPNGVMVDAGADSTGVMRRLARPRQSIAPVIVTGVALMALVTGFAWWRSLDVAGNVAAAPGPPLEPGPRSIAVLPLVDLSAAGGNTFLGDGLSEELSTTLAQIPGLRVAARTSAFEFKGKNLDVRKIGQLLGVRHVLEGSVRRNGDNVRVTVQLVDTATGYHVWGGNFDTAWRDVLELQDDIAHSVTDALQVVLKDPDQLRGAGKQHQLDTRAIDPYLAGLGALRQPGDLSRLQQAEHSFRSAIEIDSEFAGAYAGLCRTYARQFDRTRDPAALASAETICRRALALDETLVETEKALASIALASGKFESARTVYASLIERNPSDADAHIGLGDVLAGLGKGAEAEASYRQAVAAEPAYWGAYSALATYLFQRGKLIEATVALRKVTELVPSSAYAWSNLGGVLQMKGDFDQALAAYDRSLQLEPSKDAYSNLATAYYYLGRFPLAIQSYERAAALGEHDYQIQGNLADALWQVEGRRGEAAAIYRRAIQLAESELAATPDSPTLKAQLGFFYGRAGETERSQRYLSEALISGPEMIYVQYFQGVAAADRGDRQTALRAVAELVRMGYSPALLRSAPEFRSLLQDAEFKRTVGAG
jgi:TolB-like protein/tetratricopeptide (TPR) repeat protein/DNA-binding winged helix-turn-helix (wHTH) protein